MRQMITRMKTPVTSRQEEPEGKTKEAKNKNNEVSTSRMMDKKGKNKEKRNKSGEKPEENEKNDGMNEEEHNANNNEREDEDPDILIIKRRNRDSQTVAESGREES
jgi:hypothetical protein